MLVEPVMQGMYFLGSQILGLVELPGVLSLFNDHENKGNGLADSSDLGEFTPCDSCYLVTYFWGDLHLLVIWSFQKFFLALKVLEYRFWS